MWHSVSYFKTTSYIGGISEHNADESVWIYERNIEMYKMALYEDL
jgi:hypothetical protein